MFKVTAATNKYQAQTWASKISPMISRYSLPPFGNVYILLDLALELEAFRVTLIAC